jgi:hypothetical protein
MTITTVSNSKPPRKQLSDQLDRLDGILDALSDGLNQAVADAAREGTRAALKDAIVEILTDPTLRARLHEATAPEPAASPEVVPPKPGLWSRLKARAGQVVAAVARTASGAVDGVARKARAVAEMAAQGIRAVESLGSLRKLALVGLGVGVAVGVASILAPHAVAAVVSGISSAAAATAIQVSAWTRRAFRAFSLA